MANRLIALPFVAVLLFGVQYLLTGWMRGVTAASVAASVIGGGLCFLTFEMFPREHCFRSDGIWSRYAFRGAKPCERIVRADDVAAWRRAQWNGWPAVHIRRRNGDDLYLVYDRSHGGTFLEEAAFDWLNAYAERPWPAEDEAEAPPG